MEDNPFAPASGGVESDAPDREDLLEPVPLDPGEVLSRGWYIFTNNIGVVAGALLLPIIPAMIFGGISGGLDASVEFVDAPIDMVLQIASVLTDPVMNNLVGLFFSLGAIRIYLHLCRGQRAEVNMLVGEGRSYLSGLGVVFIGILAMLVVMAPAVAIGVALGSSGNYETVVVALAFYVIVLWVPVVIVTTGTQFAMYAVVDRQMGPWEAIVESWRLTHGYKMSIFFVNLLISLFSLVVACVTLGLGLILLAPVMVLTQGVMYHSLTHFKDLTSDSVW